jgi:hypothetical protein
LVFEPRIKTTQLECNMASGSPEKPNILNPFLTYRSGTIDFIDPDPLPSKSLSPTICSRHLTLLNTIAVPVQAARHIDQYQAYLNRIDKFQHK